MRKLSVAAAVAVVAVSVASFIMSPSSLGPPPGSISTHDLTLAAPAMTAGAAADAF